MIASTKRAVPAALPWIVLIHVVLFLLFWLTNQLFYTEVNDYLTNLLGFRYDFISLCLVISSAVGVWSIAQLTMDRLGLRPSLARIMTWAFRLVALIYIVFFYGSFGYLFRQSPIQVPRLGQMFLYFRIILDPIILFAITGLALLWLTRRLSRLKPAGLTPYFSVVMPAVALCALLWAIPLFYPPD